MSTTTTEFTTHGVPTPATFGHDGHDVRATDHKYRGIGIDCHTCDERLAFFDHRRVHAALVATDPAAGAGEFVLHDPENRDAWVKSNAIAVTLD